ncbi:hypothetical protein V6N13_035738 [Hibiscus sabdariffa]
MINDRYEFPLKLDRTVRNLYTLHSVLVHSGVHGGHYYAFIRPTLSDQWAHKFNPQCLMKLQGSSIRRFSWKRSITYQEAH